MSSSDDSLLIGIPKGLLAPLRELRALYDQYGSVPRAIAGIVSLYLVNGALNLGAFAVESVLSLFELATSSIDLARQLLGFNLGVVGLTLLSIIQEIQAQISVGVARLGPAGPPVAIGLASVALFVGYRLGVALLGELPGGSSLVDVLGLR